MSDRIVVYEEVCEIRAHYYKDVPTCSVVNENCTSPANQEPPKVPARGVCFACGQPVCARCSRRISYLHYGRKRICDNCIEDMKR